MPKRPENGPQVDYLCQRVRPETLHMLKPQVNGTGMQRSRAVAGQARRSQNRPEVTVKAMGEAGVVAMTVYPPSSRYQAL